MATSTTRYSAVAMLLHWLIAGLVLYNIWLAWQMEDLHGPAKIAIMQIHKPIGITILLLTLLRLAWRLLNPPPPMSTSLKPWERKLARLVHVLFYVFLIAMPLAGWAMVSASTLIRVYPIDMFGLFTWPTIEPLANLPRDEMKAANNVFGFIHKDILKILAYVLIVLHVAGALKHQFIDRDGELGRMLPFLRPPGPRTPS